MQVTFKGNPVTLEGTVIKAGNPAPTFTAIDNNLNLFHRIYSQGKKFMLVFLRLIQMFVIQKFVVLIKKQQI